jgi:putative NADPH-quinone reductase
MARRITIIQGHPDPRQHHFGHALADAYAKGAEEAGHGVRRLEVAQLEFPLMRTKEDFETAAPPESIRQAQEAIRWADHLVIIYPLWLGMMPAVLKAFFEQVFRPGFAMEYGGPSRMPKKLLTGKTARIMVTMGMPALIYRWYFGAHGSKALKRSILTLAGITPVRETLLGMVDGLTVAKRERWIEKIRELGRNGT